MGWLSDFISDPVGAVSNALSPTLQAVANAGGSILDPLNLTPIRDETKKFASSENIKGAANFATGASLTTITGGLNLAGNTETGQSVLRDKGTSRLTFGASQDFADLSSGSGKMLSGGSASESEWAGTYRFGVKAGAAIGAGALASSYGATGSQVGVGYGVAQNLSSGNIAGAVAMLPGGGLINQLVPLPGAPGRPGSPGGVSYPEFSYPYDSPLSSEGGFPLPSAQDFSQSASYAIAIGFALAGVFVLRKKGLI